MSYVKNWGLHWLQAESDLNIWRILITQEIEAAWNVLSRVTTPPTLDILIERRSGGVIHEIGMAGRAWRKSLISISVDPDNSNFSPGVAGGALRRQVVHEVHHCLRMAGPGYGETLGEALVAEGLAGQFVRELFGNPPEPWEGPVKRSILLQHFPNDGELASSEYDHAVWFFGKNGVKPRWFGYALGYEIAGGWARTAVEIDGSMWFDVPADIVLAVGKIAIRLGQ